MAQPVPRFSKKTKEEKIDWLLDTYFKGDANAKKVLNQYYNSNENLQQLHDDFIENAITNYYLPFGIAPNFLINQNLYTIPMVIEESSVVAAASNAAKFWLDRGGFTAEVISTTKNGQVHIDFYGTAELLTEFFEAIKPKLITSLDSLQKNMKNRGGGLLDIELLDATETLEGYYQLHCTFETLDAMGANFINSCLEQIAETFESEATTYEAFAKNKPKVVMSILSNYVPECLVRAEVACKVEDLDQKGIKGEKFAQDFVRAIHIAKSETRRAVTHNKGIMNGIDAVILATGNDFRAVEAGVHAYAARNGYYSSLTHAQVKDGVFRFWIEIPLALGTVGGLTSLHPLAKFALQLMQNPSARELMQLVAVAGLAQNFAAVRSLVTVGIQKGHMKMHLMNILNQQGASVKEKEKALSYFKEYAVSHTAVEQFLKEVRT
ncbi:hydroxymethylglutaryl-CoA reductase, degradative [Marinirhabdus gelatinilytica]|uniref:3-hydroxy-3-methylglutaryl coenzyme A reductase n=1 Tax=Marinirhabdus gelatinilytica TaxID=1703343 RepID=A0A370QM36_9FLAO|nr:hydroxymethylglutaryl-CoA reductase, degradative [Marinirhabdus gelatinilytica]RDK89080.1 3-hydroxy-3-methylglutaryl-coenzyme A reductase [Marinirhabdus gelatinilytica]